MDRDVLFAPVHDEADRLDGAAAGGVVAVRAGGA